jgi:hypothetical protein
MTTKFSKTNFNLLTSLALTATVIFWASAFVAIRIALRAYRPGDLALLRYAIASIALLSLATL